MQNIDKKSLISRIVVIFALDMILDISRHKFYEGLIFLLIIATIGVANGFVMVDEAVASATITSAPLQPMLRDFTLDHPLLAAIISYVLIVATSLRLTRATIIHQLFQLGSLATMALSAVVIIGLGIHGNILSTVIVAYLASEAINRICYCVAPESTLHYQFTAFMALGAMPLFDSSMLAPALLAPIVIILSRKKLREIFVAIIGLLLPAFIYCYTSWCQGAGFLSGITTMWEGMLTPSALADGNYLSLPRLIMLGMVAFVQICTSLIYFSDRLTLSLTSREIWKMLQVIVLLFTTCFVVLPSTSPASFLVLGLCISVMAPLVFNKFSGALSMVAFYTLLIIAIWAM